MNALSDARRRRLRQAYFTVLGVAGADRRSLRRHAAHGRALVLNFHSVSPHSNPYGPSLHPDRFARLLAWLQPRARFSLLRELGEHEHDPHRPLVVLSFDDGLRDFVDHAMPVLASMGLRANQNVIGRCVESGQAPWAIGVLDLLAASPVQRVRRLRVGGFAGALTSADDYGKERYGAALTGHLKALPPALRATACSELREALGDVVVERPTHMMSADDVAAARRAGHEIGSHSFSHESMEHLSDAAFLEDFHRSCRTLAGAGCDDCAIYAFPNGSYRPVQPELLEQHGVRHVLLVGERPSQPGSRLHHRLTVRGDRAAELRARAAHALGPDLRRMRGFAGRAPARD